MGVWAFGRRRHLSKEKTNETEAKGLEEGMMLLEYGAGTLGAANGASSGRS